MQMADLELEHNYSGNQLSAGGALFERIKRALNIATNLPPKAEVMAMVGQAYDAHVAPIDIPYVPNAIEPWVDSALKAIVLAQVSRFYDKLAAGS